MLRPVAESTGIPKAADPESAPVQARRKLVVAMPESGLGQEKPAARRRRGGCLSEVASFPISVLLER